MQRIVAGEYQLCEVIVRRYNQRLYLVASFIVENREETEDIVQDTYDRAFEHFSQLEGRALIAAWLTKTAVNGTRKP